ncbi:hypothetical protein B5S28_g5283 [[Candida] boidinii]|nr:hypothetical protein B5S28_g5283 [[Candida] boidinii]OWB63691.1 hypothetical protein B5S29_g4692 [[Candida] boidinii]OWB73832.1 hypothetical protein B5S31_g3596 [[Candida] boidinii]OWB81080.1 hypothetical protein B5S32_g5430 [[Candida] boidinii]GMF52799.1 unnamed protein product [[Candida] boidinii]
MKFIGLNLPNVKPKYSFILPLLAMSVWWIMLIALLTRWVTEGKPIYPNIHHMTWLVYLSNIGATNLQGVFIALTALQGIFYVWSTIQELNLRRKYYLLPLIENKNSTFRNTKNYHYFSIFSSSIASTSILLVSCIRDDKYGNVHMSFVVIFIIFVFLSLISNLIAYILYSIEYPYEKTYFTISYIYKIIFIIIGVGLAIAFGVLSGKDIYGPAASCEWALCFFYGLMFIIISIDLTRKFPNVEKNNLNNITDDDHQGGDNNTTADTTKEDDLNSNSTSDIV